jgi:hypothetical protein
MPGIGLVLGPYMWMAAEVGWHFYRQDFAITKEDYFSAFSFVIVF